MSDLKEALKHPESINSIWGLMENNRASKEENGKVHCESNFPCDKCPEYEQCAGAEPVFYEDEERKDD
jgi:hypothetical protein